MGYWGDSKWAQSQWPVIIGNAKKNSGFTSYFWALNFKRLNT